MLLYPTPANNFLKIKLHFNQPAPFTIAIYNIQGALLLQYSEDAVSEFNKTIPTLNLTSGNYFISLQGKNTNMVKQFVVQH